MVFSVRTSVFIGAFVLATLLSETFGHSYVTSPQSRSNQKQTESGCRGPACTGPCDIPLASRSASAAIHSARRGDSISVQWPRNNHAGGFIRFAWAPTSQSDNASYFDNHVQQINCHEVGGCYPDDPSNPNGGDSGPADGSSRACTSNFTIPVDLADGQWTLQWAWFGGAFSLGDYYSCVDYSIAGGSSGPTPVPIFVGGDYSYPNQQKCKFFNTDRLHVCVNEPCSNPIYPVAQQESGPPAYVQINFNSSSASNPPANPSTTAASTPSTTGVAGPSTTGSAQPYTTGNSQPYTTGTARPLPGSSSSSTTGSAPIAIPSTTASTPSSTCTSGNMKCLNSSTYSMCNWGSWGVAQPCAPGTHCSPSGAYIYCLNNPTPVVTPSTTTTSQSTATTGSSSSSSSSSGTCTLGYQKCYGTNAYQTCGNGANGPTWYPAQSCQPGLSCHPSATANNIYCY